MWVASTLGFFSAVKNNQATGRAVEVLVRARCKADIFNLFEKFGGTFTMTRPTADEARDYRWRVSMKRRDWQQILATLGGEVDYSNFKNEIHTRPDQDNKSRAYLSIWSAMLRVQHLEDPSGEQKAQAHFDWPIGDAWAEDMAREADLEAGRASRFDDPSPEPTKTIKSVTTEDQEKQ